LGLLAAGALLAGCLNPSASPPATSAKPEPAAYVAPAMPHVDAASLLADHAAFVTKYNVRKGTDPRHEGAREALTTLYKSYGLEVYRHNFTEGGLDQANIVGIRWGVD